MKGKWKKRIKDLELMQTFLQSKLDGVRGGLTRIEGGLTRIEQKTRMDDARTLARREMTMGDGREPGNPTMWGTKERTKEIEALRKMLSTECQQLIDNVSSIQRITTQGIEDHSHKIRSLALELNEAIREGINA
jgi:hypothetical protein